MKTTGIVLIIVGCLMMMFTGFKFVTQKEVADIGPIEINKRESHWVYWPPVAGAVLLVGGAVLLLAGKKRMA